MNLVLWRVVSSFRGGKAFNREVREGFAKVAKKSKIEVKTLPSARHTVQG